MSFWQVTTAKSATCEGTKAEHLRWTFILIGFVLLVVSCHTWSRVSLKRFFPSRPRGMPRISVMETLSGSKVKAVGPGPMDRKPLELPHKLTSATK